MGARLEPYPATRINAGIARRFDAVASLLERQGANRFRVQAYRDGAATLRRLEYPVSDLHRREGLEGLERLPAIGPVLSRGIRDVLLTGRLPILDRLRGESDPITVLRSVPGIGPVMADRLLHELGIESLEDLEVAAHDGRLERVSGMGAKTVAGIRDCLATRLGRLRTPIDIEHLSEPPVAELLDVDAEYRFRVDRGELHRIAPRRFNPLHEVWLPIMHTMRGHRHYTVLFSNTARAHRAGRTRDWVVVYFDDGRGHQATVITAQRGPLRGKRIVRGREEECEQLYLLGRVRPRDNGNVSDTRKAPGGNRAVRHPTGAGHER